MNTGLIRFQVSDDRKDLLVGEVTAGVLCQRTNLKLLASSRPSVKESAVIGVPHADLGEAVVAVVVPNDGIEIDAQELEAFITDDLARYKQPKSYRVVDELPRNVMGKSKKVS